MWIFLLVLGIIILIVGIIYAFNIEDSSYNDEIWFILGAFIGIIGGIILTICSIVGLNGGFDDHSVKTEVAVVSDAVPVIPKDSIYAVQYVISWKNEDGVWCGSNVKLFGKTEKNIGDTIVVNIK